MNDHIEVLRDLREQYASNPSVTSAIDAAISLMSAKPVLWVSPNDLNNPNFIGINAVKEGHEDKGRYYTLPLYVRQLD